MSGLTPNSSFGVPIYPDALLRGVADRNAFNRGPPEDCGGIGGYSFLLPALSGPKTADERDLVQWAGDFDPEQFDLDAMKRPSLMSGVPRSVSRLWYNQRQLELFGIGWTGIVAGVKAVLGLFLGFSPSFLLRS
ncbi:MAG: hypothetical protein NTU47_02410 [Ignavibacteriales bacterium]|nr:hypothetical protein [Ignavibacteriales bacterium]